MFRHRLVDGPGKGEATIVISGAALFTHAEEIQGALRRALERCDHLTIDVVAIEAFDGTFLVLLCSLRRSSELGNKRISLQGALTGCGDERTSCALANGCLFEGRSERCLLWEAIEQCERAADGG